MAGLPQDAQTQTPAKQAKPFHLFVYGTLMSPMTFRAVLGVRLVYGTGADGVTSFQARDAVLAGYKKISPDGTYLYAVPEEYGRINGYLIGPLPGESMAALRRYEGRNYRKARVDVQTAEGPVSAVAFLGKPDALSRSFGWRFRDHLKQEVLLQDKIEEALMKDEMARLRTDEELTRRALREVHGRTIRDLVRRHFDSGGISDFAINQAILDEPLPEIGREVATDPAARSVAPNYVAMLVKQVMFNQTEDRIRDEFRYELDRMQMSEKYYERTISALAAMRLMNAQRGLLQLLVGDALADLPLTGRTLLDYIRWAIRASDLAYDPAAAHAEVRYIREHLSSGHIPLGAELEFSNTGHDVVRETPGPRRRDAAYDGFWYFRDFGLDILTWKLGGHVDDHHVKSSAQRRRGFFELALGSLSVEANISKPITDDPWLLNQIIHAAIAFYDVAPHSLHISLQLRSPNRPVEDRLLPMEAMKCLLALAGDPAREGDGRVRIRRLAGEEIIRIKPAKHMLFSQTSRRRAADEDADLPASRGRWVQQFKFLRLSPEINYEPIIVALKGLQVFYKPGSFLTGAQFRRQDAMREMFEGLLAWGNAAEPLGESEIELFLEAVREGVMHEHRGGPGHTSAYVAYCLARLREGLAAFNALFPHP